ncbi:YmaF-like protein [Anaerobacterium chartisolvens]|uniref:YmaF-like protein n=1 Tax=Anaerobacterium chartisolvens TaxID=1297424 RepID=A0A369B279_9FIRM|nr:YmaF family protein [Anaerobacterium chartisolvens]RCX15445.1 YmaF-like protein [Anaerobacterium chartisolvens]
MHYHLHMYKLETNTENGHKHRMCGYTESMLGFNAVHFHYLRGTCSYASHTHYYCAITGLPIKTENGHVHKIEGFVEQGCMHRHSYSGCTNEDTDCMRGGSPQEIYMT